MPSYIAITRCLWGRGGIADVPDADMINSL
jgi:hypothetical protein